MKTDARRLEKIVAALSPRETFMLWMSGAHEQHESLMAYVMWLKDQPVEQFPLRRLPEQVEQAVRDAARGKKEPYLEHQVKQAVREVVFYHELHGDLNSRLMCEWRAMCLNLIVTLEQTMRFMRKDPSTQEDIDQAHERVVDAACEFLL